MIENIKRKLSNKDFTTRAPQRVVDTEKEKLKNFQTNLEKLEKNLLTLG